VLNVVTLLWDANAHSKGFSSMYTEEWAEKLYRGFQRNLTRPFRFVVYTDRGRAFKVPTAMRRIDTRTPSYADCIQPFELNEPMILVGLDTIITGNIDHLADYCLSAEIMALPVDPYAKAPGGGRIACNGVCLVPAGHRHVWDHWNGQNDMEWVRRQEHAFIDDLFPGQVVSWKGSVERHGLGDARIIYFHGRRKPHELTGNPIIAEHWR
jgi:hypothetical protein